MQPRSSDALYLGVATVVLTTMTLVAAILWRTGGTFVYTLDDPAIHLSVARRLVDHGTWGIEAGEFQSASSSPLWTLLLAPTQWLLPGKAGEVAPLLLNLAAAAGVIALLAPELGRLLESGRRRGYLAVAVVVVVLLFLPVLALTGMEHIAHMALVLAAALATERGSKGWLPLLLIFLATLTRGESAFVAVGLAVAVTTVAAGPLRRRLVTSARIGASAIGAFALVAAVNLAFGQGLLPNPVLLKGVGIRGQTDRSLVGIWERLSADPLVAALLIISVAVLVVAKVRRMDRLWREAAFPSTVVTAAVVLHAVLASIDGEGRYEAYLLALGAWMILRAVPVVVESLPRRRWLTLSTAVLVLLPLAPLQLRRTVSAPDRAALFYEQRYQVAQFLHDNYEHDPIAIGELGYISLYHDGPLTDVYGLGDHEVLDAWMDDRNDADFWRQLQKERGFKVVAIYDFSLAGQLPDDWISVASWRSPDAYYKVTEFRVAVPEEVGPLRDKLVEYETQLPEDVEVAYNPLADFAAATQMDREK